MPRCEDRPVVENNWNAMAMIHTGNWQVNVLAWHAIGKPRKILLFVGEGMSSDACERFFRKKGGVVERCAEPLRRKAPASEHARTIEAFLRGKLQNRETCMLFRSGGKQLMREGMLAAYSGMVRDPAWRDRLGSSVFDQELAIERNGQTEWIPVRTEELGLEDYFEIAGYHLKRCDRIDDDGIGDPWKPVRDWIDGRSDWANLWERSVDMAVRQWQKQRKAERIVTLDILATESLEHLFPAVSGDIEAPLWIGKLWEQAFLRLWLAKQMRAAGSHKLYANVEIKISADPQAQVVTEMDYVAVFPNGGILVFECKADFEAAASKPSQAEVRNRIADRLTGLAEPTCFLIPAKNEEERREIEGKATAQYPESLNFQTVVVDLSRKDDGHPRLRQVVESIKNN